MLCEKCGFENPPAANFCSSCGAPVGGADGDATITFTVIDGGETGQERTLALGELAAGNAILLVQRGTNVGATYLLDSNVVRAGRHPDNEVFLDDITVSRRHAEFRRQANRYVLHDVGSLNGTYCNGDRVDTVVLGHGDEVQIGKFKLIFLTGPVDR